MNYENMTAHEINQAVTCEVFGCHDWCVNKDGSFYHCGILGDAYIHQEVVDYCNNPSDAWPIIVENDITLFSPDYNKGDNDWRAEIYDSDEGIFDFTCVNPLRAAMIVFLMVQEAKRG